MSGMEGKVLLTAGVLLFLGDQYYKNKKRAYQQAIANDEAGIDFYKSPTPAPYQLCQSGNLYYEEMRKAGLPPVSMTLGPMGVPNYYFPRPGGRGYYVVSSY